MGRGQKKGNKKGQEPPDLSTLSISDPQPSTSAPALTTAAEVPKTPEEPKTAEEPKTDEPIGLGLTGGASRPKRKKNKGQSVPSSDSTSVASAAPSESTSAAALVQPPCEGQAEPKTEETGGLGLESTKRKRNRGPKHAKPDSDQATTPGAIGPDAFGPPLPGASGPPIPSGSWNRATTPLATPQQGFAAPQTGAAPPPVFAPPQQAPRQQQGIQPKIAVQGQVTRPASNRGLSIPHKIPPSRVLVEATPTIVLTNYLSMEIKCLRIHRYDVTFTPDKPKKLIPRAFINTMQDNKFPRKFIAFDQVKNCYCLKPLDIPPNERFIHNTEVLDNNGKPVKFEVSIKFTGVVDFKTIIDYMKNKGSSLNPPAEAIQCIDVVLRQATLQDYVKSGRQFFRRPSNPLDLTGGLEMWTGLFQSAIFTSRAYINIDVAHKGFPKCQTLITALTRDFNLDTSMPIEKQRGRGVEQFESFIRNLRVIALIGGDQKGQKREYICNGLAEPAKNLRFMFTNPDGKEIKMTVADYFSKIKGIRLRYPDLNCVWVGPRDKSIYYPMEFLEVSYGQVCNKQLNEMQLSTMVKTAAAPPNERRLKIEEVKKAIKYSTNEYFKNFGLDISDEFVEVEAKILKPPVLAVGPKQTTIPRNGSWQARGLLKAQPLESWGFVAIEVNPSYCSFDSIINLIGRTGVELGMTVAKPKICHFNARIDQMNNIFLDAVDRDVNFMFVVVSTRGRDYYQRVKKLAERDVGILTQCIKEFTAAKRMNPQTVKNILLKVNSKLMGINQALDNRCMPPCLKGNVMVVGADVTHPSPDQQNVPSIAAVTASMDPDCYMYNIELSVQTPKKEMIMDFEEMMVDHLKIYKQRMNQLPSKIYYFRDGVSEGQFAQVMNCEITAMTRAYARMAGPQGRVPEILFLLVQKRHHTRFFLEKENSKNVLPGTVVDKDIVHASELDFYLVSHQAIKGTARPTRYHAVQNDSKIPADQVEQLTYYLCHLYSRCMRAVSYPTPTYYAHLACMRAKALTYGDRFDNQALEKNPVRLRVLSKMLEFSRMFFV